MTVDPIQLGEKVSYDAKKILNNLLWLMQKKLTNVTSFFDLMIEEAIKTDIYDIYISSFIHDYVLFVN
jgi:hypothetical protein